MTEGALLPRDIPEYGATILCVETGLLKEWIEVRKSVGNWFI